MSETTVSGTGTQTVLTTSSGPARPVTSSSLQVESDQAPSTNQLAPQVGKSGTKRKRGSFDQKSGLPSKMLQLSERRKIGFIGAGNMARALAEGWLASGNVKPSDIIATVRSACSPNLMTMKALGVNVSLSNYDVIGQCDIIVITVKPYQVLDIMQEIHQAFKTNQITIGIQSPIILRPLIISVAASVPLTELEKKAEISWQIGGSPITGHLPIIRCVPNIGCAVRSGVTVFTKGRFCNEEDVKPFVSLFSSLGHCEEVEEKYMDMFVGLTGSGLAFMEIALEAMADGGVMVGVPHPMALRLSAHTMLGAANLVLKKNLHPAEVKNAVASPAGTTIAGILALESGGFRGDMIKAVKAAVDRAMELRQS